MPEYDDELARIVAELNRAAPGGGPVEKPLRLPQDLGSLDAPDQLMPTYELWTIRRESWLPPFPLPYHYERDRDAGSKFQD